MNIDSFLFAGHLDNGEKIISIIHRHPLILLKDSFRGLLIGLVLPVLLYFFFPGLIFIAFVWFCVGILAFLYFFIDWYFDAWLVTNTGVIDIERNGIFDRSSTRIEYHMIEGIAFNIKGFWQTIFNFGEITIDKLGAGTTVVLHDATNPKKVERILMKNQEKFVSSKSLRDHSALKDMLSEMIAYHIQNEKVKIPKKD